MGAASVFGRVGRILAPIAIGLAHGSIGFGGVFVMTTVVLADIQAEELVAQGRTRAYSPEPIDGAGYAG